MDYRHSKRTRTGTNIYSNRLRSLLPSAIGLQRFPNFRKVALIPFAVISSAFFTSTSSKAYAEAVSVSTAAVSKKAFGFSLVPQGITDFFDNISNWFKELPHNIAEWSVELMGTLYELCSTLILKTPLWIFNNDWFQNTTYYFSVLSIGLVTVLTILESIKRMLSGFKNKRKQNHMDFKKIMKRWGLVAGLTTAVPFIFQKAFQALNFVSEKLISLGVGTMQSIALPESIQLIDVTILLLFDVVLISTIVPVLWKNGRRFFDIMVLGVISPLALTAWIFDSYKHLFNQWWDNLKHLSLVQVYYALFLLVLGWFIFGVPTPDTFTGLIVKILVVIGGFARMTDPPRIVAKHLDKGGGFDEVLDGAKKATKNTKENIAKTVQFFKKPYSLATKLLKK